MPELPRSRCSPGAVSSLERTSGTGFNAANREVLGFEPSELRGDGSLAAAWGRESG
ncbi:MAG TPA: hypothetical protein VHK06_05355 [Candidatus Limnocylindria bacterium]|nr:hypothetical protein [Candidatus Limnocylindria bacterium]